MLWNCKFVFADLVCRQKLKVAAEDHRSAMAAQAAAASDYQETKRLVEVIRCCLFILILIRILSLSVQLSKAFFRYKYQPKYQIKTGFGAADFSPSANRGAETGYRETTIALVTANVDKSLLKANAEMLSDFNESRLVLLQELLQDAPSDSHIAEVLLLLRVRLSLPLTRV